MEQVVRSDLAPNLAWTCVPEAVPVPVITPIAVQREIVELLRFRQVDLHVLAQIPVEACGASLLRAEADEMGVGGIRPQSQPVDQRPQGRIQARKCCRSLVVGRHV